LGVFGAKISYKPVVISIPVLNYFVKNMLTTEKADNLSTSENSTITKLQQR